MLALAIGSIDYGYPWWLSYGHLPILSAGLAIGFLGYARKWSGGAMLVVTALVLWSGTALVIERFVINVNGRTELPTQSFLATGAGPESIGGGLPVPAPACDRPVREKDAWSNGQSSRTRGIAPER